MIKYSRSICIISAPSGTGKSTLITHAIKQNTCCFPDNTQVSISYTTRTKRTGEIHGKDYYFISKKKFNNMIDNGMFLEYAQVFDNYYGTEKNSINTMLNSGIHIILNIDWQGAKQVRKKISNIYTIFILPPSKKELEQRLRIRGKDTNKTIIKRIQESINEINHIQEYDYIIVNNNFDIAVIHLQSIILSEQLRITCQKKRHHTLINNLLSLKF